MYMYGHPPFYVGATIAKFLKKNEVALFNKGSVTFIVFRTKETIIRIFTRRSDGSGCNFARLDTRVLNDGIYYPIDVNFKIINPVDNYEYYGNEYYDNNYKTELEEIEKKYEDRLRACELLHSAINDQYAFE